MQVKLDGECPPFLQCQRMEFESASERDKILNLGAASKLFYRESVLSVTACALSTVIKRLPVSDWNFYAVIYWLNRVNGGKFANLKYTNLRKHLFIGRVRGYELSAINAVTLKMIGIFDVNDHRLILDAIRNVVEHDDLENVVANTLN